MSKAGAVTSPPPASPHLGATGIAVPKLVMPPKSGSMPAVQHGLPVNPPGLGVPVNPPGLSPPSQAGLPKLAGPPKLVLPDACAQLSQKPAAAKFDMDKLCRDIRGLENLAPAQWRINTAEVFNKLMKDQALEEELRASHAAKEKLAGALLGGFGHFQPWQQEELEGRVPALLAKGKGKDKS